MVASYDNFRPTSRASTNRDGTTAERVIRIYSADEGGALADSDAPKYGDSISVGGVTLYCNGVTADQVPEGVNADGALLFEVKATYATLDKSPQDGKARWSVSSQNEQVKRFAVDKATDKQDWPAESGSVPGPTTAYTGLGIGVTQDGAEGVDVDDPFEVLRIDLWMAPTAVGAYLAAVRALRNHVNSDTFSGPWGTYAVGEARLVSYNVQHVNGELDQVSLEIAWRENVSFDVDFSGGGSDTVTKGGHQYYWQRTAKAKTDDEKAQMDVLDAHVDTVYPDGAFSGLGITWAMFDMVEPS